MNRKTVGGISLLLILATGVARADPSPARSGTASREVDPDAEARMLEPLVPSFSIQEMNEYEQARASVRSRIFLGMAGGAFLTLLASGVSLIAVGMSDEMGSVGYTAGGFISLSLATALAFVGLEFF